MKKSMKHVVIFLFIKSLLFGQGVAPIDSDLNGKLEIATKLNLLYLSQNSSADWSKDYEQTTDIFFIASDFETGGDFYNGGSGFSPIGTWTGGSFTGSFDGQNFTVDGITINRISSDYIGFFGMTNNAKLKNIILTNIIVKGHYHVGGLVGYGSATVNNCSSDGSVGGTTDIGGLVGSAFFGATIDNSSSSGSVAGKNYTGGLVGSSRGPISNSYSTSSVYGSHLYPGGLVGLNYSYINNSFSIGNVSNGPTGSSPGGLVGKNDGSGIVENSFWDTQTSGMTYSDGGTGKTTDEMQNISTFTDETTIGLTVAWDFETNPNDDNANDNYWDMDPMGIVNNGYPFLSWENGGEVALPVELTSFVAKTANNSVVLIWQTTTEVDNYGFLIQRKTQITNWEEIAFVEGHGNSNSPKEYMFVDIDKLNGIVKYRLKQIDNDGAFEYSDIVEVEISSVSEFKLSQNYPNPFNPTTIIGYSIPEREFVSLKVFEILGGEVKVLVNKYQQPGNYEVNFDAKDLPSGVYIYRIKSGGFSHTQKMVLLK
ncbi:MAG: T9SS type A sorting domain-containing protein [Ignavibacteriales bacterium]|nr:T9SS type A sorting domain-containing protein [Ignavibacteriales bacterium]MCF8316584.1 T9SS type A sorting domain-containing protein [Ignavibacteriales bacterium]MCF8438296.1 T9SS type A sorting domain-containing protein [Ignavibacteriales bacterium]